MSRSESDRESRWVCSSVGKLSDGEGRALRNKNNSHGLNYKYYSLVACKTRTEQDGNVLSSS